MSIRDVKEVEKAYEEYKRITSDRELMNAIINMDMAEMDNAQRITDARLKGEKEGIKKGEAIGEVRGEEKKKVEIAKRLLDMKMPIEDIIEATGLTKEEVENL